MNHFDTQRSKQVDINGAYKQNGGPCNCLRSNTIVDEGNPDMVAYAEIFLDHCFMIFVGFVDAPSNALATRLYWGTRTPCGDDDSANSTTDELVGLCASHATRDKHRKGKLLVRFVKHSRSHSLVH